MSRRYRRKRPVPALEYPANLPIVHRRGEIIDAIHRNQIVIISGETGSGKTTQLPKICLEAGRGLKGLIGCTQPRRIAALSIAARIAEEMGDEKGVGCKIRFHDSSGPENLIRVMTDGMLLAEIQKSPNLSAYDTIIIDEAHERSLNIDVLLGMMKRLIACRDTLKLIITSATLDTQEFSRHFNDAPVIEVSGRVFPVDIRYMPPEEDSMSLAENAASCVKMIMEESQRGDILVFQPTEQDIRETIELVSREFAGRLNIVPLYARLPAAQQNKAFELGGRRKLVVATNVAETSLTIPGIRYVADTGLARISRYNPGTGTHGLPIDLISRASAEQRAGRCGRVSDGICIRLYSEESYRTRLEYTPPEIKRTNLAEVVLRLLHLGIEDIEKFPFVTPPLSAGIRDGLRTLREIGALDTVKHRRLTPSGRLMSRLPIDPRLAKMLIQADQESCLGDVLPIVAALSIHDPREFPPEKKTQARSAHAVFRDENSDFISWLNIWDAFRAGGGKESYTGRIKKFCKEHYLSFRRMREWMDVHRQLALVMEENGYRIRRMKTTAWLDKHGHFTPRYAAIHRALLSGLLSHIARREEEGVYLATRNRKTYIHPGSALKKSSQPWIVAAELVNTSRLFARLAAAIDPQWLEDLAAHLVKKSWNNPHWSQKTGTVMAEEQTHLFGFLIAEGRMVPYGPINPPEAREIFIKSCLVESASS
ncbi:MAG: ATP-dependent RNA helicase HrpA, partial [spirochete symbiont of Stewartia floridana]